ncbi:MAG: PIG-L family deacetylase [Candidatus Brocadiia bacterium]|jgi:LmbE family N-acetylglucosaminyl deacetylase|nr:PIG-L family deacetylase [Candidatus Brocadiia bacterium]
MTQGRDESVRPVAMAIGAHPDDIEFMMAGTLLMLKDAGAESHMWNLANGNCGTAVHEHEEIIRLRWREARDAARTAGAAIYPPLTNDIDLSYEKGLLAKVGAVIRQVKPRILLVPSPVDYMEDHQNAVRLAVSAAFCRGMRNFPTDPPAPPWDGEMAVYHAMPYGLRDPLRRRIRPGQYVDVGPALATKRAMLACHRTQKEWLDVSQGLDAYLTAMEEMCREVGRMSGRFEYAEGWRRRLHLGFAADADRDPLSELLCESCWTDPAHEDSLG